MVVAGPIGAGKTTLSQKLIVSVPEPTRIIWFGSRRIPVTNCCFLHISPELSNRALILKYLLMLYNGGNRYLVIMDEVHKISAAVL